MDVASVTRRLAALHEDRRWIIATDVAAASTGLVTALEEWGAAGVMVVAAQPGIGDLPDVPIAYTGTGSGRTGMEGMRRFDAAIAAPSAGVQTAVDDFDPAGDALVVVAPFSSRRDALGRRVYGPRPISQEQLEDKLLADALWDAAGIARAPSEIVPVADAGAAARDLAGPRGSVWVADNKRGWHGGSTHVRWVRTPEDVNEAIAWFGECADRVRVMPFLDGIPCSIHGWVTANGVAVLRPLEMLMLRRVDRTGLFYAGMANFWDPPWRQRCEMRRAARQVGVHLAARYGYRGPFGIDGVLTEAGFRPTELNPRLTAGHIAPAEAAGLPPGALFRAHIEGDLELDAVWLERKLLTAGDASRRGRGMALTGEPPPEEELDIRFENGTAVECTENDRQARLAAGTGPQGGAVLVRFEPGAIPPGPSAAPMTVAAIDLARTRWNLDVPPVAPAPDLFAGRR